MLVILPALAAFLGLNVWILLTSLRRGVYRLRGGGQRTPSGTSPRVSFSIERSDRPVAFWLFAGFNVCYVMVLTYIVYLAAVETYRSLLAGQWD